jgi:hypothetical protein
VATVVRACPKKAFFRKRFENGADLLLTCMDRDFFLRIQMKFAENVRFGTNPTRRCSLRKSFDGA